MVQILVFGVSYEKNIRRADYPCNSVLGICHPFNGFFIKEFIVKHDLKVFSLHRPGVGEKVKVYDYISGDYHPVETGIVKAVSGDNVTVSVVPYWALDTVRFTVKWET